MQRVIVAVSHSCSFYPGIVSTARPFGTLLETYDRMSKRFLAYIETSDVVFNEFSLYFLETPTTGCGITTRL